jgi:hypothetical protein
MNKQKIPKKALNMIVEAKFQSRRPRSRWEQQVRKRCHTNRRKNPKRK